MASGIKEQNLTLILIMYGKGYYTDWKNRINGLLKGDALPFRK